MQIVEPLVPPPADTAQNVRQNSGCSSGGGLLVGQRSHADQPRIILEAVQGRYAVWPIGAVGLWRIDVSRRGWPDRGLNVDTALSTYTALPVPGYRGGAWPTLFRHALDPATRDGCRFGSLVLYG